MNLETVSKEHMDALKALSETNLKVSEVQNTLKNMHDMENEYLIEREGKVAEKISTLLEESKDVIKQTVGNYKKVKDFLNTTSTFAEELTKSYEELTKLVDSFREKQELWDENVAEQQKELDDAKRLNEIDKQIIKNDKKSIEIAYESIKNDRRKIADERGVLERAINRLKEGKI